MSPTAAADIRFVECTDAVGLSAVHRPLWDNYTAMSSGGAVADFNNDGWQDIYFVAGGEASDSLFINNGDGTFTDHAEKAGIATPHRGVGIAVGDYDSDGWIDIFVTSLGPSDIFISMPGYHLLYHNNGDGTFTDRAEEAGVNFTSPAKPDGMGACFGDYDLDGDLDLFVTAWTPGIGGNVLLQNKGDGTFTDVTEPAGVLNDSIWGFTPRFVDMDGDRYPELLITGDFRTSLYYRNNGNGTFTDITEDSGTGLDDNGMGSAIGDFNNDGLFDWFVTSVYSLVGAEYEYPTPGTGNMLYLNNGNHRFQEIAKRAGVHDGGWGWGAVSMDVDHDGYLDLVETNGFPVLNRDAKQEWLRDKSYIFGNNGDLTFTDKTDHYGFRHYIEGRGMVHLDYDNDGDQDIAIFNRQEKITFFRHDLSGENIHWLRVFLDTAESEELAPNGIGSRVTVSIGHMRLHRYLDGGPGYLGSSELSAHFGLGRAAQVDELKIEWANGDTTVRHNVSSDQTITVKH